MLGYFITEDKDGVCNSNIFTGKIKDSKRSVVANELLNIVLAVTHTYRVLRLSPEEVKMSLMVIVVPG